MHYIRKTLLSLSVNLDGLPVLCRFLIDPIARNLCHSLRTHGWDTLNVIETALSVFYANFNHYSENTYTVKPALDRTCLRRKPALHGIFFLIF